MDQPNGGGIDVIVRTTDSEGGAAVSDESCNQALAAYAGRMISVCGHLSDYGDRVQESQQVNSEQQQPSDSEPETMEQLREQVATLTRKLKDANDTYQICLQSHWKAGRRSAIDKLQAWLRPVLEVVSDHPDHTSILAVSVLEFLPQIASRLIEE
jgi:hypothetical protein